MPLIPERIELEEYTFLYTPLMLKPARKLYSEVIRKYGKVAASFFEAFQAPENLRLNHDVSAFVGSITGSLGSAIAQLSESIDPDWLDATMEKIIFPQLQVEINGQMVPILAQYDWYQLEFGTKCSVEIELFIKILGVQYDDFFVRLKKVSSIAGEIQKSLSLSNYQKP